MTILKSQIVISLWVLLFFSITSFAQNNKNNQELGKQFIETLNSNNYEKFIALFSEDCSYEEVCSGRKYIGKDNVKMYIRSTIEGMPDTKFNMVSICTNEKYVMIEWVWHGTNSIGWPAMGINPTDKTMQLKGVSVIEIDNEKIKKVRDYWDWNSFMQGIGVEQ